MTAFLYYRPGPSKQAPPELAYAFERKPNANEVIRNGPDDGAGVIFFDHTWTEDLHRVGYFRDDQRWVKVKGYDLWVGMYDDDRPQPERLIRPRILNGHVIRLGDGNEWHIPAARRFDSTYGCVNALPTSYTMDDEGNWIRGGVIEQYRPIFDIGMEYVQAIKGSEDDSVTVVDELGWCATVLQANYRIGPVEVAMLGLLTDQTVADILMALIDLPRMQEAIKKKSVLSS